MYLCTACTFTILYVFNHSIVFWNTALSDSVNKTRISNKQLKYLCCVLNLDNTYSNHKA